VTDQYPVMHGPVAAVECNLCHVPHESSTPKLLRDTAPTVCVQCHQPELLSAEPPEHVMADKSCLECHSGHGGAKHGLLKSGIALKRAPGAPSTTWPATVPAPAPEGGRSP
jgi:predicted CXXCH cytochrome family protein